MQRDNKLLLILAFNTTLMILEIVGGILSNSLALLSDAGHMLTDSLAVFLSYLAIRWGRRPATHRRTFGYHRAEILVALANGVALLAVAGYIFYEAVLRFFHPQEVKTGILLVVATIGLAGNLFGLFILKGESHENLNLRSAFLHILADALSSVGVIIGGVIIRLTGWYLVDSLIGVLIGGIVLRGAVDLVFESGEILLEAAPRDIDMTELKGEMEKVPGVRGVHDIHVWTIGSGRRALSAHLMTDDITTREGQEIACRVRAVLAETFSITHTTLEMECDSCLSQSCEYVPKKGGLSV
ncbi:MAG: Cadmium, cobalt and zinc/H(+)-K(+) antiporter [Syntrophaceae bacterium PtaB.Bin038]|nr:MAG: Cadmium, cobalt and zinc/H(+)-K(+) antiporter [Syntrophaceae bacterium PtaB.Bin038]